jgi:hypothetical protein
LSVEHFALSLKEKTFPSLSVILPLPHFTIINHHTSVPLKTPLDVFPLSPFEYIWAVGYIGVFLLSCNTTQLLKVQRHWTYVKTSPDYWVSGEWKLMQS